MPEPTISREEEIYQDALRLLENINEVLKENPKLGTLNISMKSVIKDLNDVCVERITGRTLSGEGA
jgi:hypothetical protein